MSKSAVTERGESAWLPSMPQAVRLTEKQATIVRILAASPFPRMTGYEIAKASSGAISPGGVYVQLDLLENKGVIKSTFEPLQLGSRRVPKRFVELVRGTLHNVKEVEHERAEKSHGAPVAAAAG